MPEVPSQKPAATAPSTAQQTEATMPEVGGRWMNRYLIEKSIPWLEGETAWLATDPAACETVIIIQVKTQDPLHDAAYDVLHTIQSDFLTGPVDSRLIMEQRLEVYHRPVSITLREWLAKNKATSLELVVRWTKCLTEAVSALHAKSLAHCHLNPERIYVVKSENAIPNLVVGGLEQVLRFNRKDLIPISVDPFYAPPEAAGLFRHSPGDTLRAWDWWSVGRIIQEVVLGRHILEHLVDNTLGQSGQDEKEFAEKLLLEKAHGNTKAGGVEAMPPMDKRIDLLLLGLLASSRDARWTEEDLRKWLKGESPRERYKLAKSERLFKWEGRSYTVPEAAELFQQAETWDKGPEQMLRKDDPATFISFLREQANLRPHVQKTEELLQLVSSPDLKQFNPILVRDVLIAHSLHRIAGGRFIWKGRKLDATLIRELLDAEDGSGSALSTVQILASAPVLAPLEKLDFETFRVLGEGSKLAAEAVEHASRMNLLDRTNLRELTRVWSLAFESPASWQERIGVLREKYAATEQVEIQEIFASEHPTPEQLLILAWLIPNAESLGFITHEEWNKREETKLAERGTAVSQALFWKTLQGALQSGSWWFGKLILLLIGWGVLTAMLALAWPGPFYIPLLVFPYALAITMRLSLRSMVQPLLLGHSPGAKAWGLLDGSERCRAEASKLAESRLKKTELRKRVKEINEALAKLTHLDPPPKPLPIPPRLLSLRLLALCSWLVLLVPAGLAYLKLRHSPNPWAAFHLAWFPPEEELEYYEPPPAYKIEFPYTVPKTLRVLEAKASEPVTELQTKLGVRRGGVLVQGYLLDTIPAAILVRVPSQESFSFVIYDPKKNELASKNVYHLNSVPKRRSCVTLDGKTAFVLDY